MSFSLLKSDKSFTLNWRVDWYNFLQLLSKNCYISGSPTWIIIESGWYIIMRVSVSCIGNDQRCLPNGCITDKHTLQHTCLLFHRVYTDPHHFGACCSRCFLPEMVKFLCACCCECSPCEMFTKRKSKKKEKMIVNFSDVNFYIPD